MSDLHEVIIFKVSDRRSFNRIQFLGGVELLLKSLLLQKTKYYNNAHFDT